MAATLVVDMTQSESGPPGAAKVMGALTGDAGQDLLTGLANWHRFMSRAATTLTRAAGDARSSALLALNIDQFHHFNDQFGHESGDLVLVEVARRLDVAFGPGDRLARAGGAVARIGGDEFVVLCENVPDQAAARALCRQVAGIFEPPIHLQGTEVLVTLRIGLALASPGETDVEELIVEAESAMRRSKQRGRGAHTVYAADMREGDDQDAAGQALQRALTHGELRLYYQPKVALDSNHIVGTEALLRWQHPQRGLVAPLDFVPLAEETGLIVPIGAWVIGQACREATRWRRSFPQRPVLVVSVNVSARQFGPGLVDVVAEALAANATDPRALCLEVTESLLMDDVEGSVAVLRELAELGVVLSIDDFGTGYSSLAYLKRFPLHELKIDKSFIDGLGRDANDTAIVAAMVAMAHAMALSVVAEGVETAEQLDRLRFLGCEQAQGFHVARPGPAERIDALLRAEAGASWRSHTPDEHPPDPASKTYRPERVLVVDDDADVRQLVMMSLTAVGFEVYEAPDGATALATAKDIGPDCVLLDLAMPGMSGLEVCRALRLEPGTAESTILVLTATDDAADKVDAFSSGADDYITKPFSPRDLASRVHSAIRRRREPAERFDAALRISP